MVESLVAMIATLTNYPDLLESLIVFAIFGIIVWTTLSIDRIRTALSAALSTALSAALSTNILDWLVGLAILAFVLWNAFSDTPSPDFWTWSEPPRDSSGP